MDPGVGCHGFIANPAGNIWFKYECFLKSGCQGMDFRETLTQKTHILKMYLILTSSSTPAWTRGRCYGTKVKPTGYLWSKYEWFLISGGQDMDF